MTDLEVIFLLPLYQKYRDEVSQLIVRPFACAMGKDFLLEDNARAHTGRIAMDFVTKESIQVTRLNFNRKCHVDQKTHT